MVTALRHNAILPVFSCTTWNPDNTSQSGYEWQPGREQDGYLLTLCQYIPGTFNNFIAHYQQKEIQRALYEKGIAPIGILMNLIQQIGSALSTAHARNIVHGALIPHNILLASQERLWIADFGLARLHPPTAPYLPPELYAASSASVHTGDTSAYWHTVTPASDQYMFAILCQQLFSRILHPTDYEYLHPVLQRATQQRPAHRYPNVELFVQDLLALTMNTPPSPPVRDHAPERSGGKLDRYSSMTPAPSGSRAMAMTPVLPQPALRQQFASPYTPAPAQPFAPLTPTPQAIPLTPGALLTTNDWEKRGDKFFTMHDYEEALKAYHHALEVNPQKASLWLAMGDTYFALERYKEALMAYEQAVYLNPNEAQAWSSRGTVLDALGRHQEALDCYERAEQLH